MSMLNLLYPVSLGGGGTPSFGQQDITFVSQYNNHMRKIDTQSGSVKYDRWGHIIGTEQVDEIIVSMQNVSISTLGVSTPVGEATLSGSIEFNGITVPLLKNGQASTTIAAGQNVFMFDPIYPSQFGLSAFPVGFDFWTKTKAILSGDGVGAPVSSRTTGGLTGQQSIFVDPSVTTITNDETQTGAFTWTGADPVAKKQGWVPFILGRFSTYVPAVPVCVADSIGIGVGDSNLINNRNGGGWFNRMMRVLANGGPTAGATLATSGGGTEMGDNPDLLEWAAFGRRTIVGALGTNHIGSGGSITLEQLQGRLNSNFANFRAAGFTNVGYMQLWPRTASTDGWATQENQTPQPSWDEPTDPANQLNADILGLTTADFALTNQSVRDLNNNYNFITNGVAGYPTSDGAHPSGDMAQLVADENIAPMRVQTGF